MKVAEPKFKIGDKVETTQLYKEQIEEYNRILNMNALPYKSGTITNIQNVTDYKRISKNYSGMIQEEITNEVDKIWICVTLDDDINKQVNQDYLKLKGDEIGNKAIWKYKQDGTKVSYI